MTLSDPKSRKSFPNLRYLAFIFTRDYTTVHHFIDVYFSWLAVNSTCPNGDRRINLALWWKFLSTILLSPTKMLPYFSFHLSSSEVKNTSIFAPKHEYSLAPHFYVFGGIGLLLDTYWLFFLLAADWISDWKTEVGMVRGDCGGGVLLVGCLILSVLELCSCRVTSAYVRNDDLSLDMPLDSDVFRVPPGYNAPQQVCF